MERNSKAHQILKVGAAGLLGATVVLSLGRFEAPVGAQQASDYQRTATQLTTLFRSARKVISDNQTLINDRDKGDKGLTGEKVVALAKQNYKEAMGSELSPPNPGSLEGKLIQAMLASIREVMDKAQPLINKHGMGFKGFLPAVFGKQVADAFRRKAGGAADIKLTAPKSYIRNRANAPDAWEDRVIEAKFKANGWTKGKPFSELGEHKGQRAFRLIIPEYYGASCLTCHGEPKGEVDITGGRKEGSKLDELGGAVSMVINVR